MSSEDQTNLHGKEKRVVTKGHRRRTVIGMPQEAQKTLQKRCNKGAGEIFFIVQYTILEKVYCGMRINSPVPFFLFFGVFLCEIRDADGRKSGKHPQAE